MLKMGFRATGGVSHYRLPRTAQVSFPHLGDAGIPVLRDIGRQGLDRACRGCQRTTG
jgi:hypothetical protein